MSNPPIFHDAGPEDLADLERRIATQQSVPDRARYQPDNLDVLRAVLLLQLHRTADQGHSDNRAFGVQFFVARIRNMFQKFVVYHSKHIREDADYAEAALGRLEAAERSNTRGNG